MLWQAKLRAFLVHLALSTLVVGAVLALAVIAWYPHPYFRAMDAWTVVKMLILVDLVLGPLLTLIVFDPAKRSLRFDLTVVALVQVTALSYASLTLYQERPYFVVFSGDRFEVLAYRDVDLSELKDPALARKPWRGPRLLVAPLPEDPVERRGLVAAMLMGERPSLHFDPAFWQPYEDRQDLIASQIRSVQALAEADAQAARQIERVSQQLGDSDRLGYLPLTARGRDMELLLDRQDGRPVAVVVGADSTVATAAVSEEQP
ncbi:MAG: TfpX/TfpZ family type IV pilin accessory protein [Pseudomonadota bacterium]